MSDQKLVITAFPTKVRATLRLHKAGSFKAGDKFEVSASAGELFKMQRFGRIDNASSFSLHGVKVKGEEQLSVGNLPMFMLTGAGADVVWPTCMHPETIAFSVEATSDVAEFSCELEGLTVRSAEDAQANDYNNYPRDVTVAP